MKCRCPASLGLWPRCCLSMPSLTLRGFRAWPGTSAGGFCCDSFLVHERLQCSEALKLLHNAWHAWHDFPLVSQGFRGRWHYQLRFDSLERLMKKTLGFTTLQAVRLCARHEGSRIGEGPPQIRAAGREKWVQPAPCAGGSVRPRGSSGGPFRRRM